MIWLKKESQIFAENQQKSILKPSGYKEVLQAAWIITKYKSVHFQILSNLEQLSKH